MSPLALRFAGLAAFIAAFTPWASGSTPSQAGSGCQPDWVPTFGAASGVPSPAVVYDLEAYDDGSGAAIYITGTFGTAGATSAMRIARWNAVGYSTLGGGLSVGGGTPAEGRSLATFDDGSGLGLYVAGRFRFAGNVEVNHVARWSGGGWSALGSGLDAFANLIVSLEDAQGPALFVGGSFTTAGGQPALRIARWDGASWTGLGSGLDATPRAMTVFDDGNGPALYVAGPFTLAGGTPVEGLARWDGTSWAAVPTGMDGGIVALANFDDGNGPALYAGGSFTVAGGTPAARLARFDGSSWTEVGGGVGGSVSNLRVVDLGQGPGLLVGGNSLTAGGIGPMGVLRWNGSAWASLASSTTPEGPVRVEQMAPGDLGQGPMLFTSIPAHAAGMSSFGGLALYDGLQWRPLGTGLPSPAAAAVTYDDGGGPALYAFGQFSLPGQSSGSTILRWDGAAWSVFARLVGFGPNNGTMTVHDDGTGPALYVGGPMSEIDGVAVNNLARWDGSSWQGVPGLESFGGFSYVFSLKSHDDGTGSALYIAGLLQSIGSAGIQSLARWDGAVWSPVGDGLQGVPRVMLSAREGGQPVLYVAGSLSLPSLPSGRRVVRWDGHSWSGVGPIFNDLILTLAMHDDGNGPALYAGGMFTHVSPGVVNRVARWNGSQWQAMASGLNAPVFTLLSHMDGGRPALFAGGDFTSAFPTLTEQVARWDGASWSGLGSGFSGRIHTLLNLDTPAGDSLLAIGHSRTSSSQDSFFARYGGCAPPVAIAYCFGEAVLCPCSNGSAPGEGCANSTGAGVTLRASGSANLAIGDLAITAAQLPPNQPVLLFRAANALGGGAGLPLADGLRCAGGNAVRVGVRQSQSSGIAYWGSSLFSDLGAGNTLRFQAWYRDPVGSPCGQHSNLSHGLEVTFH